MYSFSEPRNFVDNTDLDIESEWNPHYEDSADYQSPQTEPESPNLGLMYECPHCLVAHSLDAPCNELSYTFALPLSAYYTYDTPVYVEDRSLKTNTIIEANYRKWLVSVNTN